MTIKGELDIVMNRAIYGCINLSTINLGRMKDWERCIYEHKGKERVQFIGLNVDNSNEIRNALRETQRKVKNAGDFGRKYPGKKLGNQG